MYSNALIAAIGDSTLRDIWYSLIFIYSIVKKPEISGHKHNFMSADVMSSQGNITFAFQYIPGIQKDTNKLAGPKCKYNWWNTSKWSRASQAESSLERIISSFPNKNTVLIYGGIQQSSPSASIVKHTVLGIIKCFPNIRIFVKSVNPSMIVTNPSNNHHNILHNRSDAMLYAKNISNNIEHAIKKINNVIFWNISPIIEGIYFNYISDKTGCKCHYNETYNFLFAKSLLKQPLWPFII